ncbi:shikimate kinase [Anaerorudis cellulosivorans]|uniref:shikimate kinase n=1 Tax=Anaerorudis cellulosivorans TaxID=3397862 RepID=UPI00221F6B41|nr:shikimate kinase [Seramator thermalis]MCW1734791.1 shikimate kinase [Seramator thermalis]
MERIFLIGYMGAGKTTIGKKLSKALALDFIDLDKYIQHTYQKSIYQLFEEKGEEGFRKIEQKALHEVADFENVVISCGGGTPCYFDNMEVMKKAGTTVYIQVDPEELANRLLASKTIRPLIAGKSREELIPFIDNQLRERERYYNKADLVIKRDKLITKEDVYITVNQIAEQLKTRNK